MGLLEFQTLLEKNVQNISDIVGVTVTHQAKICILGIHPDLIVNSKQSILIDFGLLQSRRMIALPWRKIDLFSKQVWVRKMAYCIVMEKLIQHT